MYIQHIREADGVTLDRAKVVKNSGRRKIAKQVGLLVRIYWGRCMYYIYILYSCKQCSCILYNIVQYCVAVNNACAYCVNPCILISISGGVRSL